MADAAVAVGGLAREIRDEVPAVHKWLNSALATVQSLRDEVSGVRGAVQPMSDDLDALRTAFAGTNDELERLREGFVPELHAVRSAADGIHEEVLRQRESIDHLNADIAEMGRLLTAGLQTMQKTLEPLVRDAHEVREVVEPLQTATERVGRVAERLPGPGRKR